MTSDRKVQAVLFDLDDTLISWEYARDGWNLFKQARNAGVHAYLRIEGHAVPPLEEFNGIVERVITELWTDVKTDFTAARVDEGLLRATDELKIPRSALNVDALLKAYGWGPIPATMPQDDAHEVLEGLSGQGLKLGLITNAMQPMWMRDIELEWHGLLQHLPVRLSSHDAGYMKPHPSIYLQALDSLGVEAANAVFVGDRPANDIAGANGVGMVSVLMRPEYLEHRVSLDDLPAEHVADHVIRSLAELPSIIAGIG